MPRTAKTTDEKTTETKKRTRKATAKVENAEKSEAEVLTEKNTAPLAEENVKAEEEPKQEAKVEETANKTPEHDELEALKAQIKLLQEQLMLQATQPQQPIQAVLYDSGEKVHLLWQAEVADDNLLLVGENGMYGRIVGKTGSAFIPKNELSRVLDTAMRAYIDQRWMIVVSGLDDEEKESLGVDYKDGEILDKKAFAKMIEMGDEMLEIFPELCESHQEMVAKRFYEAYHSNKAVKRDLVVALNKIHSYPAFKAIIEEMNAADLEDNKQ
jgi:hypothetical protein